MPSRFLALATRQVRDPAFGDTSEFGIATTDPYTGEVCCQAGSRVLDQVHPTMNNRRARPDSTVSIALSLTCSTGEEPDGVTLATVTDATQW